jgi:hypothetical protein
MGFLLPVIIGGAIVAATTFKKKQGSSDSINDGIDESTLIPADQFDNRQSENTPAPASQPSGQPTQTATTNAGSNLKPSTNVAVTKPAPANSTTVKPPFPTYPRVLFLKTKIGTFSATALISKMQQAISTKNMTALAAAYKEFMTLNNDQVRYFHNKYFEQFKVTPYAGWKTIKLSTNQQMVAILLNKLTGAGVGETPKEKI